MRVRVRDEMGRVRVSLSETDDLARFEVEVEPGSVGGADVEVAGVLRFSSPDQAWVDQGWLRENGGFRPGTRAGDAFDEMVRRAAGHGWVDAVSGEIAGHVNRPGEGGCR